MSMIVWDKLTFKTWNRWLHVFVHIAKITHREMMTGPDLMGKPRNKKMSFDDLGKVYHNISRKRILSKVSACGVPLDALRTTISFKVRLGVRAWSFCEVAIPRSGGQERPEVKLDKNGLFPPITTINSVDSTPFTLAACRCESLRLFATCLTIILQPLLLASSACIFQFVN